MYKLKLFLFLFALCLCSQGAAQKRETISKKISKDLTLQAGDVLKLAGEKANIRVTEWNKAFAQLIITFSATHTDNKTAQKELAYMQYAVTREKNIIEIRNGFILPSSVDRILSRLEVSIEVIVPAQTSVIITNKYGDAVVTKLSGNLDATLQFSDLDLHELQGSVKLLCYYSEVHGRAIKTTSFISEDEKSRIFLNLLSGAATFNSRHSDLDITVSQITSLTIDAVRTNVTVHTHRTDAFDYHLSNKEGKLYVPDEYSSKIKQNGKQLTLMTTSKPPKSLINITTSFNTLTIQ